MADTAQQAAGEPAQEMKGFWTAAFWCSFYGSGIIGTLVIYGFLQERIMTMPYGSDQFTYSVFLVFCNRIAAVIFAFALALAYREPLGNKAPLWKYLIVSLSNVYASTCQYQALLYVSFAVQMLGKSFKMAPVMVWGMFINGKRYSLQDWLVAITVTLGVTEFLMTGPTESSTATANSFVGYLWLLGFLALDGLTSTMQERLFKEHKVSKYNQMMYVNLLSSIVSIITLAASRQLWPSFGFWGSHPQFILDAAILSASAAGGQWFIYSQVKEFGALAFAATMNVRQMVSIIVSYVQFGHYITGLQVLGLVVVFAALFYKSYVGFMETRDSALQPLVPKDQTPSEAKGIAESKQAEKP